MNRVMRAIYAFVNKPLLDEYDKLADDFGKYATGQVTLEELCIKNHSVDIRASGELAKMIAVSMIEMYRANGGENYVEMLIADPTAHELFTVTVQRVLGKTPHQMKVAAEAERDALRAQLAKVPDA